VLRETAPDVVHFHHYANFGVEAFALVRRVLPEARIVLTMHEFLAICNHFGQMVTRGDLHLCRRASDARCGACFPDIAPSDFFLRRRYVQGFFDLVDQFVSPSAFLARRYVEWGVPEAKMAVVENLIPASAGPAPPAPNGAALRVGFFGQISRLKGIEVMLRAAEQLDAEGCETVSFVIFGDYRNQPEVFRADLAKRLGAPGSNVTFHGPYEHDEVDALMRGVDVVLMPSIWWENAPLVIEEALRVGEQARIVAVGVDDDPALERRQRARGLHVDHRCPARRSHQVSDRGQPDLLGRVRRGATRGQHAEARQHGDQAGGPASRTARAYPSNHGSGQHNGRTRLVQRSRVPLFSSL